MILLTFGLAAPPLALAVLCTLILATVHWQLIFGRYLVTYQPPEKTENYNFSQNKVRNVVNVFSLWHGIGLSVWVIVFGSITFYAFIVTDMMSGKIFLLSQNEPRAKNEPKISWLILAH